MLHDSFFFCILQYDDSSIAALNDCCVFFFLAVENLSLLLEDKRAEDLRTRYCENISLSTNRRRGSVKGLN